MSRDLVFAGSVAGRLYAVDLATGTPRWSMLVGSARTTVFAPVSDGSLVATGYTAFGPPHRGGIVVADARTGRLRWRREFTFLHTSARANEPTRGARQPAGAPDCTRSETAPADRAHDPVATHARAGADVARSAAAGADVARSGAAWAGGPVVLDDAIVVAASTGELYAMAREDGSLRWVVPAVPRSPLAPSYDFRPLAVANRLLLAGSLTGRLIAYDLGTRCERWRHALRGGGSIAFALVGDGRSVYVPYAGGRLVALDAATGVERWRTRLEDGRFVWPPAVDERSVYAAGSRGLFAFRR
jgi:outer membrane protein assembly factor BamB